MANLEKTVNSNKLLKKMPWLRIRSVWTDEILEVDDLTEFDAIPYGWRKNFGYKMCKEINKLLKKAKYQNEYRIIQIKEKWGFLHWYDNGVPEKYQRKLDKIIKKYGEKSKHICIMCGKKGNIDYNEYWLEPLCKDCREKQK